MPVKLCWKMNFHSCNYLKFFKVVIVYRGTQSIKMWGLYTIVHSVSSVMDNLTLTFIDNTFNTHYFTLCSFRTALARFRNAQMGDAKIKERRPYLASECEDLHKAEKWRRQVISEISRKVAQIQNGEEAFESFGLVVFLHLIYYIF